MFGYMVFLGFLIAHFVVDKAERNFTWVDWVILLYVIAMLLEEAYQISFHRRRYLTMSNMLCDVMLSCCVAYVVIRGYGSVSDSLLALRVSEHVFALAAALAFLRLMYYLQFTPKLGPIKTALEEIITVVLSFMIILGVILVAFGVALAGVYNAGMYTAEFKNGSISLPHLVGG